MSLRFDIPKVDLSDNVIRVSLMAVVGLLALLIGLVTAPGPVSQTPQPPADAPVYLRGTIEAVEGTRVTLTTSSGSITIEVAPDTRYEALRRGSFADLRVGETVNVGSLPHNQTLFVVTGVVVLPATLAEGPR